MSDIEPRPTFGIEYADAPESTAVVSVAPRYDLFIGGRWVAPVEGQYLPSINPATEEVLTEVAVAGPADVDAAVRAAREAWPAWAARPAKDRAKFVYRIARQLLERAREFAVLETLDGGKPIKESRDVDIPLAAAHFFYYAGWADKLEYAVAGRVPRPLGVAGQVIPWNFPLLMAAWKLAPALATGNVCILKPAETTPLTALLLAQVCDEAGLPPGVVNIVTGGRASGAALVEHSGIDKIAFTGSTAVGKSIQKAVAGTGKKVTLELGGKAANIIFEDAALDQAVEGIVNGIFFNQGHVCCAGSRLLVQESVAEVVLDKLRTRLATLRVGNPLDKNTDLGAINSARAIATHRDALRRRPRRRRRGIPTGLRASRQGLLVPPHRVHQRVAVAPHRARRDLRAGVERPHVPHTGRGGREGQQHTVRTLCRRLDREGFEDPLDGRPAAGRCGVGQHVQPLRSRQPVRRVPGERLRSRRWRRRPAALRAPGADRVSGIQAQTAGAAGLPRSARDGAPEVVAA